ncbi:hypothetical protein ACFLZ8_04855 [Planctomycetota bacterium]
MKKMIDDVKIRNDIDTLLMLRVKEGDIKALEILYIRHISGIIN